MHAQTCLFGREKHDAGVHWTPRDYSRVKEKIEGRIEMTGRQVKRLKQLPKILRKWKDTGN
jgi:hypothetical protein